MIPAMFRIHVLEVQSPVWVEEYGARYATWPEDNPVRRVEGVFVEGGDTSEDVDRADGQLAEFTAYVSPGHGITSADRIAVVFDRHTRVDGLHVMGSIMPRRAAFGLDHDVIRLTHREG